MIPMVDGRTKSTPERAADTSAARRLTALASASDDFLERAGAELAKAVFRTANNLLASPVDAEEVTLDVLVSLDARVKDLNKSELEKWLQTLPTWLDQSAIAKAKSRAKKRKRHAKRLDELVLLGDQLGTDGPAPKRRSALVKEVLGYLPRRHRFIHVLGAGLGHTDEEIAKLLATDAPTVSRSRTAIATKLSEFAAHTLEQRELLEALAGAGTDSPIHDYARVHGEIDAAILARLLRRLSAIAHHGPNSMEMSGDSMFDGQQSGFQYPLDESVGPNDTNTSRLAPATIPAEPDLPIDPSPRWPIYLIAGLAALGVVGLTVGQLRMNTQLAEMSETLAKLGDTTQETSAGPQRLEPGRFFELAYDSRVEPSKDGEAELLRSDAKGAELRLLSGSLALHVNTAKGVEWIVHDGRYDISSEGKRFRVTHTGAVPEVEVFEGKVRVSGGLLGGQGIEVRSKDRTLAAAMSARGELPLADLDVDDQRDAAGLELDELFARAVSLRELEPKEAQDLFRDLEVRGGESWISERALDQLRTLVAPEERADLASTYLSRFPDGAYSEPFAALRCQNLGLADEASSCWTKFGATYPHSLYGPGPGRPVGTEPKPEPEPELEPND